MVVSVEEVAVSTEEEKCDKSNGENDDSGAKRACSSEVDTNETEKNAFSNVNGTIKPTNACTNEELLTGDGNIDSKHTDDNDDDKKTKDTDEESAMQLKAISPPPILNGISHDVNQPTEAAEDVDGQLEKMEGVSETALSQPQQTEPLQDCAQNDTLSMDIDEPAVEELEPVPEPTTAPVVELKSEQREEEIEKKEVESVEKGEKVKENEDVAVVKNEVREVEEAVKGKSESDEQEVVESMSIDEETLETANSSPEEEAKETAVLEDMPHKDDEELEKPQQVAPVKEEKKEEVQPCMEDQPKASCPGELTSKCVTSEEPIQKEVPVEAMECEKVCEDLETEVTEEQQPQPASFVETEKPAAVETISSLADKLWAIKEERDPSVISSDPPVVTCTPTSAPTPTPTAVATTTTTTSTVVTASSDSVAAVVNDSVVRVKRTAQVVEDLEAERDGRISSSSSNSGSVSGSEAEPNQDCKRIRFDESIFEEDERERLIREFVDRSTDSVEEIAKNCEKLQHETAALSDLARAKELEWNSIMRLLKLKEEMLERILFKKRHLDCQNKPISSSNCGLSEPTKANRNDSNASPMSINNHVTVVPISSSCTQPTGSGGISSSTPQEFFKNSSVSIAAIDSTNKLRPHRAILPKPSSTSSASSSSSSVSASSTAAAAVAAASSLASQSHLLQPSPSSLQLSQFAAAMAASSSSHPMTMQPPHTTSVAQQQALLQSANQIGEGRQGTIVDVKSIIADFRSKNPDSLPRRGRRNMQQFGARGISDCGPGPRFSIPNSALVSMANMALGSGSHVRTNVSSTTHNDHRPPSMYLDPSMTTTLNRSDLQIRQTNLDSLMLSINSANCGNSSQPNSNTNGGNVVSSGGSNLGMAAAAAAAAAVAAAAANNPNSGVCGTNNGSFQEALVKFAKMNEKRDLSSNAPSGMHHNMSSNKNAHLPPPPPYPEVTLHPVLNPQYAGSAANQSSLLHGILTKNGGGGGGGVGGGAGGGGNSNREMHAAVNSCASSVSNGLSTTSSLGNIQHRPTTFSPTLARLLTAPEGRNRANRTTGVGSSNRNTKSALSEILNSKKTRTEVTITPVTTSCSSRNGSDVVMDDEDEAENTDRLVIDEGRDANSDASSNVIPADQVPECQGCQKKAAQFVCAGCGNQWYCSRECQVQAWEEHSEMCSG